MSHIPQTLAGHIDNPSEGEIIARLPSNPADQFVVITLFLMIAITLLGLFIFWTRRGAKMMYRAWALFALVLYLTIFLNYMLPTRLLTGNQVAFTFFVMFVNSALTIFRSWRDSEKYIPKRKVMKKLRDTEAKRVVKTDIMKKIAKMKLHAFWYTIKNGGNDVHNTQKVRRELATHLR